MGKEDVMTGTSTDIAATTPSWWRQSGPSGEADVKEDVAGGPAAAEEAGSGASFGFADFLDVINPLQHIPVISTVYRELTGDQISPTARAMGGALYGGPVGLVAALANSFSEAETGRDLGGNAVAMVSGALADDAAGTGATGVARAPAASDGSPSTALPHQITLRHEDASPDTAVAGNAPDAGGTGTTRGSDGGTIGPDPAQAARALPKRARRRRPPPPRPSPPPPRPECPGKICRPFRNGRSTG
jgi:hypothetical protein